MLSERVSLGNVVDAEAFVRHCMHKAGRLRITGDEREELVAEGLALLCELHLRYEPERDKAPGGHTTGFYGYALYLLPRKMADAWHRSQPHHVSRVQADGSRRYEYHREPKSLSELYDQGATNHDMTHLALDDTTWRHPGEFIPIPLQPAIAA